MKFMFIHIPKTGGTSMRYILRGWYKDKFITRYEKNKVIKGNYDCIYGHFDIGDLPVILFLREPFEHHLSYYNYDKKYNNVIPIDEFFGEVKSKMLLYLPKDLSRIVFAGFYEILIQDYLRLAEFLGKKPTILPVINRTDYTEYPSFSAIQKFKDNNKEIYEIYDTLRHNKSLYS